MTNEDRDDLNAQENDTGSEQPSASETPTKGKPDIGTLPEEFRTLFESQEAHIKKLNDESAGRRHEVNSLRDEMNKFKADQARAEEAKLEDQQKWEELANSRQQQITELAPFKQRYAEMETIITSLLDAQLKELPAATRRMVETMPGDATAKLNWLSENMSELRKPSLPRTGAGERSDPAPANKKYTEEQRDFARKLGVKLQ